MGQCHEVLGLVPILFEILIIDLCAGHLLPYTTLSQLLLTENKVNC